MGSLDYILGSCCFYALPTGGRTRVPPLPITDASSPDWASEVALCLASPSRPRQTSEPGKNRGNPPSQSCRFVPGLSLCQLRTHIVGEASQGTQRALGWTAWWGPARHMLRGRDPTVLLQPRPSQPGRPAPPFTEKEMEAQGGWGGSQGTGDGHAKPTLSLQLDPPRHRTSRQGGSGGRGAGQGASQGANTNG